MRRRAFTLIEILISLVVLSIILGIVFGFFSFSMKNIRELDTYQKAIIQIDNVDKILSWDFKRAGYHVNGTSPVTPTGKETTSITVKFVDYLKEGCENATYSESDNCSYTVTYTFTDNNLIRKVKKGSSNGTSAKLFDPSLFSSISGYFYADNASRRIIYTINATAKGGKVLYLKREVNCMDWRE